MNPARRTEASTSLAAQEVMSGQDNESISAGRIIPENQKSQLQTGGASLDTASPVIAADLRGVDNFLKLSAEQRLSVIFDNEALGNFSAYVKYEPKKSETLINGWQCLLNLVRAGKFVHSQNTTREVLKELHKHAYPGTFNPSFKTGEFRYETKGGFTAPLIKKSEKSLVSKAGLESYEQTLHKMYKSVCFPLCPAFLLCDYEHSKEFATSGIAIDAEGVYQLLESPPDNEAGLKAILKSARDRFPTKMRNLSWMIPPYAYLHEHSVGNWSFIDSKKLLESSTSLSPRRAVCNVLQYTRNFPNRLRHLSPPTELTSKLLIHWCQKASNQLIAISNQKQLMAVLTELLVELITVGPFRDGNCRVAVLYLQGVLMTFGITPVHLDTRYIFRLSPEEMQDLLKRAINQPHLREFQQISAHIPEELKEKVSQLK